MFIFKMEEEPKAQGDMPVLWILLRIRQESHKNFKVTYPLLNIHTSNTVPECPTVGMRSKICSCLSEWPLAASGSNGVKLLKYLWVIGSR